MKLLIPLTIAALATGPVAHAEISSQSIADTLAAQGFTRIELREGPNQIKVEAVRGTEKVETIYDRSTGGVLKTETAAVGLFDDTRAGVSLRERNSDFVRTSATSTGADNGERGRTRGGSDDGADHDAGDDHGGLAGGRGESSGRGSGGGGNGGSGGGGSGGDGSGGGGGGGNSGSGGGGD